MSLIRPLSLNYRTIAGGDRAAMIARELLAGEAFSSVGAWGRLAMGIPLCLLGPLLMTMFIRGMGSRARPPAFWLTFTLVCCTLIPLLMWLERRSRGKFIDDALTGESPGFQSYSEFEWRGTKFFWLFYTECALLGPRLVWSFIDWARDRQPADAHVRLIAAELVVELYDAGEGRQIADLLRPDRPREALFPALKYLVWHDWADVSAKRDRVWLRSPVKRRMEEQFAALV